MKKNYLKALLSKAALCTVLASGYGYAQNAYIVESIPYQIYEASTPLTSPLDDKYSEVNTIPFDFVFFGETYNQLVINGNGYIDFRTELANSPSEWQFETTIPHADFDLKNVILGCYHDINSVAAGSLGIISTSILGEAPYRKFVIGFSNMPQYFCNLDAISSFEIILHETHNYIDVQIAEKGLCEEWNNGNAVIGIINSTGAIAYTPPGRNTGQWEVSTGEGWRFRNDNLASVKDYESNNAVSLYPNPSSDILNINNSSGNDIKDVSIYSINGMKVKSNSDGSPILVSDLQAGIYHVKIQIENQTLNYKFIKQ